VRNATVWDQEVEHLLHEAGSSHLLPIVQAGEVVLRQPTEQLNGQLSKRTLNKLINAMRATMLEAPGVGLAGPQVGLGLAIAVVEDHVRASDEDYDDNDGTSNSDDNDGDDSNDQHDPREIAELPFHEIINPSYENIGDATRSFYEGCLSFDGYQAVRRRWLDIIARWDDAKGKHHEERLHGWPARIFQHETDHLSGELYIDKAEIRSLTTNENLEDLWSYDPNPQEAATELGFSI
jgi:peptide deformylase